MCPHLSVAENMFLGREKMKGFTVDRKSMEAEAKQILFDKLKEMSELEISDFYDDRCGYNGLCSVMCDIYKAITDTKENE